MVLDIERAFVITYIQYRKFSWVCQDILCWLFKISYKLSRKQTLFCSFCWFSLTKANEKDRINYIFLVRYKGFCRLYIG